MVLSLMLFEQSFVRIVTITFTSLIISEILNVATTIHRLNKWIISSQILTLILYALSLIFLKNYIDTSKIDIDFLWKVLVIVGVSWTPIHLAKCIIRRISPTEEDRITN
jgi:phospholipid-translocating ATPase